MYASAYGHTRCLERIFSEIPLKNLKFKAQCGEGPFKGTDVFWMAVLAAVRGQQQYLDKIMKVPKKDLDININVLCQRAVREAITPHFPGGLSKRSFSRFELVSSPAEIIEPYSEESTLHLLAQLAVQGKWEYLKTILRSVTLTPALLNQKIGEGPNKGATLFHLIAEAEARAFGKQSILDGIPNKVLLQLDLNSAVKGGESEGTTALYWVVATAGNNGSPNCLERIISKKPLSELNLKVRGKGDYADFTILYWLVRAVCFGHRTALEKLINNKVYQWQDFNVKDSWGATPLFYLTRDMVIDNLKLFETIFFCNAV